jgi:uncharacterized membrane protein
MYGDFDMSNAPAASSPKPISLHEFRKQRKPHRNIYRESFAKLSPMDKLACWITDRVGTMGFFLVVLVWTVLWLGWNLLAPENLQFDPPTGFVFWLFISNLIQLLLMPLIMVGQNVQGQHSEMRAEHDLAVNVKAEEEIEVILQHLEYQNTILIAMVEKLGVSLDHTLREKTLHPKA